MKSSHFLVAALTASFLFSGNALAADTHTATAVRATSPEQSGGTFKYSTNRQIAAEQKNVYDTIIRYQNALNAGDTKTILNLFADESYSQWNDKLTADTTAERRQQYDDLFQREKFETDFAFDTIWINGDTAVVRTHHHVGSVVTNFKEQKTVIDLNREVFVMRKVNGQWKIFLYTFNTNPLQGEA
ncbi:YybH family protein [Neisseria zalophi]|uniref:Nuclear transport factor 2 family protein n=1 Tax=Neisseria zalophi TaxID=640030 RepID=A0A5J6PSK7_9NEIS|nr:nuclear transport factor 2 family protein [Neisseria zalophi]QEY25711.1 nuclear transport factor 2 family protein [Neisseria zalophi]